MDGLRAGERASPAAPAARRAVETYAAAASLDPARAGRWADRLQRFAAALA